MGAVYLPPQPSHRQVGARPNGIGRASTIIGDINYCGGSKKRALEEWIEAEELEDIGREEHTHVWGRHKCRIDRVLTTRGESPWFFKGVVHICSRSERWWKKDGRKQGNREEQGDKSSMA